MRVAYVVSLFPCWSETFIVREIKALQRRGVDVTIVSLKEPSEDLVHPDARAMARAVLYAPGGVRGAFAAFTTCARAPLATLCIALAAIQGLWRKPAELMKTFGALGRGAQVASVLRARGIEHVHAHWATYPSTVAMLLARCLGVPFSFTSHAHDIFLHDHLLDRKLRSAAFSVTISHYNRRVLAERYGDDLLSRIRVIHCGVELNDFPALRGAPASSRILSVGRLDAIKGFRHLIDACRKLVASGVDFECDIIGDGPERAKLSAEIAAAKLQERVRLRGALSQDLVRAAMAEASVFVLPCVRTPAGNQDGIPVALMEAMASELPVVTTMVSGIPELVRDGQSGCVVAPHDSTALAAAITRVLSDPVLRATLARAGRQTIEADFDADVEGAKVLNEIVRSRHRMKLLLLTDELEVGGSQRQILTIARQMPRDQFDVHVAYFRNASYMAEELRASQIPVVCLAKRRRVDPAFVYRLWRYLRRERFDVIHAFAHSAEFWGALVHLLQVPGAFVSSVRNRYDWYTPLHWRAKAFASWRSTLVVANSSVGGQHAVAHGGVPSRKLRVVHNGVDSAAFARTDRTAARSTLGLAQDRPVLVSVGRLVAQKNVPCVLHALKTLKQEMQRPPLLILVGDGPLRDELQALCAQLSLQSDVVLAGERADVPLFLAAADVAVQSSIYEGLSNALLEAMASGLPVVATAVGGTPEFVTDGVTGFLVPSNDHAAMARRIRELLERAELAADMSRRGRARIAKEFSVESMIEKMQIVYSDAIERCA